MTSEKWQQIKQICGAALELSPELRPAFLVEACNGETDVRREVEVLLASFDSQFLEQPAIDKALEQIINRGLVVGQTISHYKVREKIGAGGMGEVYRARDTLLDRQIALKVLLPEFCYNADRVRRFQLEARAASALNHPNILTGGEPVRLTDKYSNLAAVSPDGKFIACFYWNEQSDTPKQIAVIPFSGGSPVKLFPAPQSELLLMPIRWTTDGRAITYLDKQGGVSNLWRQPLGGGAAQQLTDFKTDETFTYDWSPDGELAISRGAWVSDAVMFSDSH